VSVYVEVGSELVEAFVRDHGPGFDLADVPPDRFGVRESILGRMSRQGGSARVRRLEHGTEVSLYLPVTTGSPTDAARDNDGEPDTVTQPDTEGTR
jgi:signal transduction histidine kinase